MVKLQNRVNKISVLPFQKQSFVDVLLSDTFRNCYLSKQDFTSCFKVYVVDFE